MSLELGRYQDARYDKLVFGVGQGKDALDCYSAVCMYDVIGRSEMSGEKR